MDGSMLSDVKATADPVEEPPRKADHFDVDSVTLARLMAEVRNDDAVEATAYNRMHNRHNR